MAIRITNKPWGNVARPQPQRSLRFHISQTGQRIGAGHQLRLELRLMLDTFSWQNLEFHAAHRSVGSIVSLASCLDKSQ